MTTQHASASTAQSLHSRSGLIHGHQAGLLSALGWLRLQLSLLGISVKIEFRGFTLPNALVALLWCWKSHLYVRVGTWPAVALPNMMRRNARYKASVNVPKLKIIDAASGLKRRSHQAHACPRGNYS